MGNKGKGEKGNVTREKRKVVHSYDGVMTVMVFLPRHDKIFGVPARVDCTLKGDGARHETRWKRKAYQKFCEYMQHHSAHFPKSCGRFRAGLFATWGSLISTIPLAWQRLTLASGSLYPSILVHLLQWNRPARRHCRAHPDPLQSRPW